MPQLAILGGGVWGGAFAKALLSSPPPVTPNAVTASTANNNGADNITAPPAANLHICFWDRNPAVAQDLAQQSGGVYQTHIAELLPATDIIIVAVSSGGFCAVLQEIANCGQLPLPPILWLTKGFVDDDLLLCEAAAALLPANSCFGVLSGPTFATEIAAGLPAAMVLAVNQPTPLHDLQTILHRKMLRLYASDDLLGVCVSGALKNVIAIAAGICDGLQLGANARAAVITRGLSEMDAFNRAAGGRTDTLASIAGIGDLLLTCTSDLSRNRQLGLALGRGQPPASGSTQTPLGVTTEGIGAAASAHRRAKKMQLTLPIISAVHDVLQGKLPPAKAVEQLLSRPPRQ